MVTSLACGGGGGSVTLLSLTYGDVGCYVEFSRGGAEPETLPGMYDLCGDGTPDPTAWIGQEVVLTVGRHAMPAASCGGDPECPDTEMVDFVEAIARP